MFGTANRRFLLRDDSASTTSGRSSIHAGAMFEPNVPVA
jgi:hypothetical protein